MWTSTSAVEIQLRLWALTEHASVFCLRLLGFNFSSCLLLSHLLLLELHDSSSTRDLFDQDDTRINAGSHHSSWDPLHHLTLSGRLLHQHYMVLHRLRTPQISCVLRRTILRPRSRQSRCKTHLRYRSASCQPHPQCFVSVKRRAIYKLLRLFTVEGSDMRRDGSPSAGSRGIRGELQRSQLYTHA